jgi:capsular polysaccharide export protein
MTITTGTHKTFLFLQGPHGPFFRQLGAKLTATGARVLRVGFNAGDAAFWRNRATYIRYDAPPDRWPDTLRALIARHAVSDIVLYGDTRPIHAQAVSVARALGLTVHVFEEGYLRPFWITYERGGANGNSRLMDLSVAQMQSRLSGAPGEMPQAPDHWGDMREHVFYGALYHWFVWFANRNYPHFTPHRTLPVSREFQLYFNRLALMPLHWGERIRATRRIKRGAFPYHLALLQLEHDASFRAHSPFASMTDFLRLVIEGFARGAPPHHHLVFKAHPLEDGRTPLRRDIRALARQHGIAERTHFVRGGKLARLLDAAQSAVTVNSTAAQQVLWRALPLKIFGTAVYAKPAFVSDQPLAQFFAAPRRPDSAAYRDYRQYLLETSQVPGGYYAARARRQLLRKLVDMMLCDLDPYDAKNIAKTGQFAAPAQQLRLVNDA